MATEFTCCKQKPEPVKQIKLNTTSIELRTGETFELKVAQNVLWSSSNQIITEGGHKAE